MRLFPGSARTLSRALALLLVLLAVLIPVSPLAAYEGDDTTEGTIASSSASVDSAAGHAGSHLESSWPRDGVMLWVPPKEARLTYLEPVKASTLVLTLARLDGELLVEDEVVRLTSGENVIEILLRLPLIRPGMYELKWSVTTVSDAPLQGSIGFGLEPPIAAVGGQNHRHGESHLYQDTPGQFALRLLFVAASAFLFASVRRARIVNGKGALERLLLRVGAGLLLLAALITGVVDVTKWLDEYHDKPFSAITAAPGLAILIPVLAFSVFSLVRARPSMPVFWCGLGSLAAYAGLSHAIQTALGAEFFVVFTALLVSLALVWAEMLRMLLAPTPVAPGTDVSSRGRVLSGSALVLVGSSLLMLVLHAGTLDLEMAFIRDLRSRLVFSMVLLTGLGAFSLLTSRRRGLRLLALIPASIVLVVSALLAWMPPPAAGL
jgi:methionine-rich copper-binding protein CopC